MATGTTITITTRMPTSTGSSGRLRLWQLISPALPVGAYSYSGGLETAIGQDWITEAGGVEAWIAGQLEHGLSMLDVPVLARLHAAWGEDPTDGVMHWTRFLAASRETAELRAEDAHLGGALEIGRASCR